MCRLFISTVFALARIIFCTCRPRRHQQRVVFRLFALFLSFFFSFCHLPLSSALHLFMLCSHSLGVLPLFALYAVAARAQLIFVDSFFVHVVCVYVCENVLVCVCVSDEFFCVYHFFCRPPSSDVDVGVGVVLFGAAGRVIFFSCIVVVVTCVVRLFVCVCVFYLTPLSLHTT